MIPVAVDQEADRLALVHLIVCRGDGDRRVRVAHVQAQRVRRTDGVARTVAEVTFGAGEVVGQAAAVMLDPAVDPAALDVAAGQQDGANLPAGGSRIGLVLPDREFMLLVAWCKREGGHVVGRVDGMVEVVRMVDQRQEGPRMRIRVSARATGLEANLVAFEDIPDPGVSLERQSGRRHRMEGHLRNVVVAHAHCRRAGVADRVGEAAGADDGHADLSVPFVAGVGLRREAQGAGRHSRLKRDLDDLQPLRERAHDLLVSGDAHAHPLARSGHTASGDREDRILTLGNRALLGGDEEGR